MVNRTRLFAVSAIVAGLGASGCKQDTPPQTARADSWQDTERTIRDWDESSTRNAEQNMDDAKRTIERQDQESTQQMEQNAEDAKKTIKNQDQQSTEQMEQNADDARKTISGDKDSSDAD
jgi:hypothetical protein